MTLELRQTIPAGDMKMVSDALAQLERGEKTVTIPASLTAFLSEILRQIQQGESITVLTNTPELTTNQAAELLGVSRPFLVNNLLEAGVIPFHYVGSHRRVYLTDLVAYKEEKARQHALLDEMTAFEQEQGWY